MKERFRLLMFVVAFLLALNARPALSQSTIFTVPTTDTVTKGNVNFEFDYHARKPNLGPADRINTMIPKVVGGVARNVEIGLNVAIERTSDIAVPALNRSADVRTNPIVETNIKWKFASNGKLGLAASVGGVMVVPLTYRASEPRYGLIFSNLSKKITAGNYGPRFTAGPYAVVASQYSWRGPRGGVILGYEQPIHSWAQLVTDWYSGQNQVGYLTPGISFALPGESAVSAGYSVGNDSYGNDRTNRFPVVRYKIKL